MHFTLHVFLHSCLYPLCITPCDTCHLSSPFWQWIIFARTWRYLTSALTSATLNLASGTLQKVESKFPTRTHNENRHCQARLFKRKRIIGIVPRTRRFVLFFLLLGRWGRFLTFLFRLFLFLLILLSSDNLHGRKRPRQFRAASDSCEEEKVGTKISSHCQARNK